MRIIANAALLASISAAFLLSACSGQPKPLYNYEDYSDSYYGAKKNMTQESALVLQKSMENAIERASESSSGRVAPGMYANLGYMYLKDGKSKEAIANFEKEKALYPESTRFMERMIQKVQAAQGAENEKQ
jgi:hypothetical protein